MFSLIILRTIGIYQSAFIEHVLIGLSGDMTPIDIAFIRSKVKVTMVIFFKTCFLLLSWNYWSHICQRFYTCWLIFRYIWPLFSLDSHFHHFLVYKVKGHGHKNNFCEKEGACVLFDILVLYWFVCSQIGKINHHLHYCSLFYSVFSCTCSRYLHFKRITAMLQGGRCAGVIIYSQCCVCLILPFHRIQQVLLLR